MRNLYRYLAMALATAVIIQAAVIAWGAFGILDDVDAGLVVDKNYEENAGFALHTMIGNMVIPALALALLIVGILVRSVAGALRWASIVCVLVLLQAVSAEVAVSAPLVGLVHGANALLILLASVKAVLTVPRTNRVTA